MILLQHIADYIVEEIKEYNNHVTTIYPNNTIIIQISKPNPNVFIIVSPAGIRIKYWRENGGSTPYIMDFDFGDPTMINTIKNKLKDWAMEPWI